MKTVYVLILLWANTALAAMTTADSLVMVRTQIDSLKMVAQRLESTISAKALDVAVQADPILKAGNIKVLPSTDESYVVLDLSGLSAEDYKIAKLEADIYCFSPGGMGRVPEEVSGEQKLILRKDVLVGVQEVISAVLKE